MKQIDEEKTEIFAIWEYDSYEDYQTIESRVRADRAHIERVHRWYEKHGGKDHVLGAYIIEVKNEEIQSTLEEKK